MTILDALLAILGGFRITATVALLGLLYAVPFALVLGVLQFVSRGWRHALLTAVIEFWRSSPIIILLFVFYYTLPTLGIKLDALVVGTLVLGLNTGGYGSQAVRGALQAVDRGQRLAAAAIGLTPWKSMLYIELPQACTAMIPTFINLFIQLVKNTALISLITLHDLTYHAKALAQAQYNPVPIYTGLLLSYLMVCYPLTILGRMAERRFNPAKRSAA
ncbi:MAG: amino acid ABC transporter permease [Janthinobacterium lividum]